ncbi:MAG: hypothetical protein EBW90_10350 [Rhodobacteraceae bacterium]|nr:hypothetical protein [Paracoccaceae bacterium]
MIIRINYNKTTSEITLTKDEDLVNAVINEATIVDGSDNLSFEIAVQLDEWNNQFEIDGDNNE